MMTIKEIKATAKEMTANIQPSDVQARCENLANVCLSSGFTKEKVAEAVRDYLRDLTIKAEQETTINLPGNNPF